MSRKNYEGNIYSGLRSDLQRTSLQKSFASTFKIYLIQEKTLLELFAKSIQFKFEVPLKLYLRKKFETLRQNSC